LEASEAADPILDAAIDPESIDQLIVAHNFGNVQKHTSQSDAVPSLAAWVKRLLKIGNPIASHTTLYSAVPDGFRR